jgi:hypothetical protein
MVMSDWRVGDQGREEVVDSLDQRVVVVVVVVVVDEGSRE